MGKLLLYNNFSKYTLAKVEILVWNRIFKLCLRLKALLFSPLSLNIGKYLPCLFNFFLHCRPSLSLSLIIAHSRKFLHLNALPPLILSANWLLPLIAHPLAPSSHSAKCKHVRRFSSSHDFLLEEKEEEEGGEKVEETCTPPCVHSSLIVDWIL